MKRPEVLDEETCKLSPMGLAYTSMKEAGLVDSMDDVRFKLFWLLFQERMRAFGYVHEEEEECD